MIDWRDPLDWFFGITLTLFVGGLVVLILWACGVIFVDHSHDNQHCVQSHEETYLMPVGSGKYGPTGWIPMTDTVCDKWVPNGK